MQTNYCCPGCGRVAVITSQGDLPVAVETQDVSEVQIGDKKYPLKNEKGETLKNVLNGVPSYWTPPPAAPAPVAPTEPLPTH